MKLLVASSFFPASEDDCVPQFVREQIVCLAGAVDNLEVLVVSSSRPNFIGEQGLPENVKVKRFNYFMSPRLQSLTNYGILPSLRNSRWNYLLLPFLFVFEFIAIKRAVNKFSPDCIYSHWFLPQALLCHLAIKGTSVKHIFTSHSMDVEVCKKIPWLGRRLVCGVIRRVDAATVVSNRTLISVESFFSSVEWGAISRKFSVIPMGIDVSRFNGSKPTSNLIGGSPVILFVGRLVEKKGVSVLLDALSKLRLEGVDFKFVVCGEGSSKQALVDYAQALGLESFVDFRGYVVGKEKEYLIRKSDVFVLPSILSSDGDREGLPVSLMENLSAGNICVATSVSGAEEVLEDGVNGYLCRAGDSSDLANVLMRVLGLDDLSLRVVSNNARELSKEFGWEVITKKYLTHLNNLDVL